jgi:hypothetical protein
VKIDWLALGTVAAVSIVASVAFILLLASGIRLLSVAKVRSNQGTSSSAPQSAGYTLIGLAGLLVLLGLYLIIPQFR